MTRSHTKSRRGCLQCKKRRVKCDETLPGCVRCARRDERCSYIDEYGTRSLPSQSITPPLLRQCSEPASSTSNHLEDIELTHIFLTQTHESLWRRPAVRNLWKHDAFSAALKEPALLGGILAIAAMHMVAIKHPPEKRYQVMALRNQAVALEGFVKLLPQMNEETADAVFLLSLLVTYWAFASRNLPTELSVFSNSRDDPTWLFDNADLESMSSVQKFITVLKNIQPIRDIVEQGRQWLLGGSMSEYMRAPRDDELPELPPFVVGALDKLERRAEQEQTRLLTTPGRPFLSLKFIYRISMCPEWAEILIGWIIALPAEFLAALEEENELALVMLGYWAVSMSALDDRWWARGWGYDLVKDVATRVGPEWADLAEWPVQNYGWLELHVAK